MNGLLAPFQKAVGVSFLLLMAAAPRLAAAQESPNQAVQPVANRDFLFGSPRGWIAVRGSWLQPREEGDLFVFIRNHLTIDKGDFHTPAIAGEVGFSATSRLGVAGGVEFGRRTVPSEYRHFVDNRRLPINQKTVLAQTNITGSLKIALRDPGRSVSRLAFVPRAIVPYAGAGLGICYYELRQVGDFVDFASPSLRIFPDVFRSQGWMPSAHVFAGTDLRLWRALFLEVEGRYVWAHGELGSDYLGFDGIDLDGFRLSTGFSVLF